MITAPSIAAYFTMITLDSMNSSTIASIQTVEEGLD